MENTLKDQFRAEYAVNIRERCFNILNEGISDMINLMERLEETPDDEMSFIRKEVHEQLADDLMSLCALTSALKMFGRPKSLMLIIQSGQAIDLLKIQDLKEDEAFNQMIDNLKK